MGKAVYAHDADGLVTEGPLNTGKVVPEHTQPGVLIPWSGSSSWRVQEMVGPGVMEAGFEDDAEVDEGPLLHSPQQPLTGLLQELESNPSPSKGGSRAVNSPLGAWRFIFDGGGAAVKPIGMALLH